MNAARFVSPFRRIQWKLTISYTLVTTGVIFTLFLLLVLFAFGLLLTTPRLVTGALFTAMRTATLEPATYLTRTPPDQTGLQTWLDGALQGEQFVFRSANGSTQGTFTNVHEVIIVDAAGLIVAREPPSGINEPLAQEELSSPAQTAVQQALRGRIDPETVTVIDEMTGDLLMAYPIFNAQNEVVGALILLMSNPQTQGDFFSWGTIWQLLPFFFIIFIPAAFMGAIFGFVASRGFTRRLHALAQATEAWRRGDFTPRVHDASGDEIGQLARQLNEMAEQLQWLLQTRMELASLEERNRLARDLHDSVKQQIFATTMQLAAANALMNSQPQEAWPHLVEAEKLARQAQQELTGLIQELRPAALAGKGLAEALQAYVADWSRQTTIPAAVRTWGERPLPLEIEQSLFRVAQEALANVARHSQAHRVDLHLAWQDNQVTLTVKDNGRGFQPEAPAGGLGLQSMKERVAARHGRFTVRSQPGQGTTVSAIIPFSPGDTVSLASEEFI